MKQVVVIFAILLLSSACNKSVNTDLSNDAVAKVGDHILTRQEYESMLPEVLNSSDSLIIAESIVSGWVKESLMYDLAISNLNNSEEIDQLVENYRRSLITYQYQERLIYEKMSDKLSEKEIEKFYNENADKFRVETTLIKGLFLKIPKDAPEINKIKEWYKSASVNEIEKIEKYSLQNAVNYDYFYDRWVRFDNVMQLFPPEETVDGELLRRQKQIEAQDSVFYYLLNVKEVLFPGQTQPFEYAKENTRDVILNQKRLEFIRNFENDLYKTAVGKGMVKR